MNEAIDIDARRELFVDRFLVESMEDVAFKMQSIYHGPAGRRYTLRTDGFVSLRAGFAGGTVTTKPFSCDGAELSLNFATSAAGSVRVELQDETGRPLPGRSLADASVGNPNAGFTNANLEAVYSGPGVGT